MSLTLNMVGGGGGGKLKETDAVLIVTVPTGSTVTATKGGVTLTPTIWVKVENASLDCAIFSIPASQFDSTTPWTITASQGSNITSTTILITTNKEYEVELSYHVPSGYQEVEYIESTGTQHIITGIMPSDVRGGTFSFIKTADVAYSFLWGAGSDSSNVNNALGFRISTGGQQSPGLYYGGVSNFLSANVDTGTSYVVEFTCSSGSQSLRINNISSSSSYSSTITGNFPITLFTFHYATTIKSAERCKARLKHIEFYGVDSTEILNMYPCYRKSDSVAGMWDKVSESFFQNAGSGSFIVGPDVN